MPEKIIIVHPCCVFGSERFHLPESTSPHAPLAQALISQAIRQAQRLVLVDSLPESLAAEGRLAAPALAGDVYVIEYGNPDWAQDCVTGSDQVTIMGAFRADCASRSALAAIKSHAQVNLSLFGTV